jgi:polymorphic toxin system nucleotidyltransferase-like protein
MLLNEPFGGVIPGARGAVLSTLLRTDAGLAGRQVHALVSDRHSLWSVQEALKAWVQLGVIRTQVVGRAVVHVINEDHFTVTPLRSLLDPMTALTETAAQIAGDSVQAIILFGSVARGEAREGSDIDLAVIAIHSGINAKDAIVTALTGITSKSKNHSAAAGDLKQALGQRPDEAPDGVR